MPLCLGLRVGHWPSPCYHGGCVERPPHCSFCSRTTARLWLPHSLVYDFILYCLRASRSPNRPLAPALPSSRPMVAPTLLWHSTTPCPSASSQPCVCVLPMCIQVSRSATGPCPAIIVPHGGPHTALAVNYYMPFSFLTALGYCVIAVNYRGSLGFGEAGVQSLPRHAGHYDVEDCVASLDAAVAAGEAAKTCVGGV
jgi:acetyl esterase/lipase